MPQRSAARRHLPDGAIVAPALDPPSPRDLRRPVQAGVPDDLFRSWLHPLRHNPKVRRDLNKYLRNVPKPQQLLEWADQQRTFAGPVLIVRARDDKLMPPTHAERLADHFQNTQLVWIDDSRTLIPIDQPKTVTNAWGGHLRQHHHRRRHVGPAPAQLRRHQHHRRQLPPPSPLSHQPTTNNYDHTTPEWGISLIAVNCQELLLSHPG